MHEQTSQSVGATAITDVVWTWFLRQVAWVRSSEIPGWVWVVLLWVVMAFPAVSLRGTHYEEGTVIGLARGALEDGHWLSPHLYGERFVERPVLLSWIGAALGKLTGGVSIWSVRVPHLLFLLAGGLMIYNLVRPLTRRAPAVYGALCWFACPMIAQKFVAAEPDVTMSVLLFAGFFLWWKGESAGRVSLARWVVIGLLLAAAGLTKGPQPLAYFTLGVGAYLLVKRRWANMPGFVLANVIAALVVASWYWAVMQGNDLQGWRAHSRLADGMSLAKWFWDHLDFLYSIVVEWLPGSLLLIPATVALARGQAFRDNNLMLAVILYAVVCSLALLVWPGGIATRYAMPANPALAVLGGLLFEAWWARRPWLMAACNTIVVTLCCYLVLLGWIVMPLAPDTFRQSKLAAQTIEAVRVLVPGPLLVRTANLDILAYVAAPVRVVPIAEIEAVTVPTLAILTPADVAEISADRPQFRLVAHAALNDKTASKVFEIRPQ
jgi:4-amino-4-deoxy-L-arabinose transferase-like glycosyltransferase